METILKIKIFPYSLELNEIDTIEIFDLIIRLLQTPIFVILTNFSLALAMNKFESVLQK